MSDEAGVLLRTSPLGAQCRLIDLSARERLPLLIEMMRSVSSAKTPAEVQAGFGVGMRKLRGIDGYLSTSVRDLESGTFKLTRRLLEDVTGETVASNAWRDWHSLPVLRGGFLGEIMSRGVPALVQRMRIPDDPAVGTDLAPFGSVMAVPLWDDGAILNWGFFLARHQEWFDADLLEEFLVSTNLVGGTVRNVLANERLREAHDEKLKEIDRIARIQRALLPSPLPSIRGALLGAHYATFDEAGGDLYAVREVAVRSGASTDGGKQWLLLIADASGHGPSAAVVSAMVDAIVATVPEPIEGPANILETLNEYLVARKIESGFVTAFLGLFDPTTRTLRYARAGHNPPIVRSSCSEKRVRLLEDVGDIPLGIANNLKYEETTVTLASGETLVMYTDGITEAREPSGEMFGVERIEDALRKCSGAPECAVHHITSHLLEFEAGVRPGDDQTLLVLQVDGECSEAPIRA
ncbi:MAG: PP2C family protein-serine/threonine phosphatase [Phycisphaerae bacterium]|nr:PP2C family protein-serine/threonine phosphatase [Phycisphaerae bacterium]